jgi:hypothetical protein
MLAFGWFPIPDRFLKPVRSNKKQLLVDPRFFKGEISVPSSFYYHPVVPPIRRAKAWGFAATMAQSLGPAMGYAKAKA